MTWRDGEIGGGETKYWYGKLVSIGPIYVNHVQYTCMLVAPIEFDFEVRLRGILKIGFRAMQNSSVCQYKTLSKQILILCFI